MTSLLEDRGKQDYRAVPITEPMEKTEPKLTEIQLEDECDSASQIAYSRTMPKLKAQCAGTLSRNNQSSWYFIVQGAVDAGLAIGPIFFFSKYSSACTWLYP